MKKNTLEEIHRMGMAFAEHPRSVQVISLDAWTNLKEVNAHFVRTGKGPMYEIMIDHIRTVLDFDFVSVKLTDMGLAHFENRHNTKTQEVEGEILTGRLRFLYHPVTQFENEGRLQQEWQVRRGMETTNEWRNVPSEPMEHAT